MRIGVAGKTGSGKTTVSALLALAAAGRGRRVTAVDTDPNPNLGLSLGLDLAALGEARVVPRVLVTGRGSGGVTGAQVVAAYGLATPSGVTLLHAMAPSETGAGCACPSHASPHSPLAAALEEGVDLAVVDLEAGLDHLGRPSGTLAHVDALLLVVDPTRKSILSALRLAGQARRWGITRVAGVGNKARPDGGDADLLAAASEECGAELYGVVALSPAIAEADRAGCGLVLSAGGLRASVEAILDRVEGG